MKNPNFRSLCAELMEWAGKTSAHYYVKPDLFVRARAALAQPAPEPPEAPADGEVAELVQWLRAHAAAWKEIDHRAGLKHSPLAERFTRTADLLEQFIATAGEGPGDEELNELWNCCGSGDEYGHHEGNIFEYARAVLTRYAPAAHAPVPVAERLPGEGDQDVNGCAWYWAETGGGWYYRDADQANHSGITHWLPWRALPLPGEVKK